MSNYEEKNLERNLLYIIYLIYFSFSNFKLFSVQFKLKIVLSIKHEY